MRISELYRTGDGPGPFTGKEVVVVGSGSSLDCHLIDHFRDKTCILLNQAWLVCPQLGPVAFANNRKFLAGCKLPYQIVKGRHVQPRLKRTRGEFPTDNHCRWNDPNYYVFSYRCPYQGDKWDHFDDVALWKEPDFFWNVKNGSVAIFAVQFALLAGARSITLVGCDCCAFGCQDYASPHDPRKGFKHDYRAYARGLEKLWEECRLRGVPLMHLSPYPGLGYHEEQHGRFRAWLKTQGM